MKTRTEKSLLDVFYGQPLQKSPDFENAKEEPENSKKLGLTVRTSARIQAARDRLAQHTRASQARIQASSPFTPEQQRKVAAAMDMFEQERNEQIRAAQQQFSGEQLEQAMRMIHAMHDEKSKKFLATMTAPTPLPAPKGEEPMERSLLDVFYGRRLRKAEERPPEEDDDLPGPDEDDYDYEEPSEEEMARDPNWEHGYHPDGSRIIPEAPSGRPSSSQFRSPDVDDDYEYVDPSEEEMARSPNWEHGYHPDGSRIIPEWMHQDDEAPKPESFPRNVSVEEEDHGDREDPSLESVRQMISPRLEENPANHDPYIWSSLDRDARGKRYKKSESFAEQKEVFQKSVPFPMQMKYGPISPVRKFAR